jgi:hypothetical protein
MNYKPYNVLLGNAEIAARYDGINVKYMNLSTPPSFASGTDQEVPPWRLSNMRPFAVVLVGVIGNVEIVHDTAVEHRDHLAAVFSSFLLKVCQRVRHYPNNEETFPLELFFFFFFFFFFMVFPLRYWLSSLSLSFLDAGQTG